MLNETQKVYYVLTVNGEAVSAQHESELLAEMAKDKLAEDIKGIAVVTPVNESGQQVLLG